MPAKEHLNEEPIREAAAQWHDRLQRESVSAETQAAFARWRSQLPEHDAAYLEVERAWSSLHHAADDPQVLALRHETALRLTRRASRLMWPLAWAAALVLAVAIGTQVTSVWSRLGLDATPKRYATAIGERLSVTLSDGSQVTLNSGTEVKPSFDGTTRTILLLYGQALFEVAKDPSRPFIVQARGQRFVALGTAFDVRIDGERVQVTMLEGRVALLSPTPHVGEQAQARGPILSAGDQLTVGPAVRQARVQSTDPNRVTAWRRGQVIFENMRLADAIAELNRYSEKRLELADPELADLKLSGAFATGQPSLFVEAVTEYFPVTAEQVDERTIVLRSRQ
jgi:transmembrane sensor